MIGPISLIVYIENHEEKWAKAFKYNYLTWKGISSAYKVFWDFYFDWGLFRGTKPNNRFLRD